MAETSGFFQAQWDETLQNPETGEWTGWWDRDYIASQFANYFKLFVGNGVFGSPTNQLKVVPGTGMTVIVKSGWAFINGYWYYNDTDLILPIASNGSSATRVDSVRLRWTNASRAISAMVFTGDVNNVRTSSTYDLKIAEVSVPVGAVEISAANITDTRTNEAVCGLVKGLMEIETTADLFAQYNAIFNAWFDTIKDQLAGDLGARLQLEFDQLNQNVEDYQDDVEADIAQYKSDIQTSIATSEAAIRQDISDYHLDAQAQIDAATALVEDYVNNDYVIQEREFVFVNKVCTISDSKVKATSLLDVYFTAATITHAEDCKISVDSSAGLITLTAEVQPTQTIRGMIRVRVN